MKDESFKEFILDQLDRLGHVDCRAMFGGHGLYRNGIFFGIISKSRLYFKTCETTLPGYRERGMQPFRPSAKQTLKTYYEVPVEVVEDEDLLAEWARDAEASKRNSGK